MEKQFVTHDIALSLKELGFDEPCMARFTAQKDLVISGCYTDSDPIMLGVCNSDIHESNIAAPLWQQVIDWFREKHKLNIYIIPNHVFDESKNVFRIDSKDKKLILDKLNNVYSFISEWMNTYEEAREAAIIEAIKIVKGKK